MLDASNSTSLRILYVDDDSLNRTVVADMLAIADAQMVGADSGESGIDWLVREPFDILLMDLRMPLMDGLTAVRIVRNMGFGLLPIVIVTADTSVDIRDRSLAAGADDILFKPVAMDALFEMLGRMLARSAL